MRIAVVVLGDLGRSPRMQYQALALADAGAAVELVGYCEHPVYPQVRARSDIRVHCLAGTGHGQSRGRGYLASSILRTIRQHLQLLRTLMIRLPPCDAILVQNPPSVPTLPVALLASRLRRARLIVDWHNFGHTILALKLRPGHPALRCYRWLERTFGRRGDGHLCVSHAMRSVLAEQWRVPDARVLYDRPLQFDPPVGVTARHEWLDRLEVPPPDRDRTALVVCPTGWTADEDADLLLDAMTTLDRAIADRPGTRCRIEVIMTGRGPLREAFERQLAASRPAHVYIHTLWLEHDAYRGLLRAADLGICLHRSSSGVDLPMKLADMNGAGLPACALDYGPCLAERLHDGENGLLFHSGDELAKRMLELFEEHAPGNPRLARLREGVRREAGDDWLRGWQREARDVFGLG